MKRTCAEPGHHPYIGIVPASARDRHVVLDSSSTEVRAELVASLTEPTAGICPTSAHQCLSALRYNGPGHTPGKRGTWDLVWARRQRGTCMWGGPLPPQEPLLLLCCNRAPGTEGEQTAQPLLLLCCNHPAGLHLLPDLLPAGRDLCLVPSPVSKRLCLPVRDGARHRSRPTCWSSPCPRPLAMCRTGRVSLYVP